MIDQTTPHATGLAALDEGVGLVIDAEDGGDWKRVIDWLAGNPSQAFALANFLATQRGLKIALAPPHGRSALPGLELIEEIGRGTFGVVYRAREPALNREVAVKIVSALGEADLARFRFEAEAAAGLDDRNVVSVLSFGEADGVPYLVMPFVPGGSLSRWLSNRGPNRTLSPEQAAKIVHGIALGVHHAHQRGLIHRDLKPGNVLLDEEDRPRIADFGLARPVNASMSCAAGTPAYMAPEQVRGDRHLTTGVDIHALGVILFELLAGRTPFAGEDAISMMRRIEEEPVPPMQSLGVKVPADLESICRRCLEKRPEDRYPSAQAVATDLARFLAGEPVEGQTRGVIEDVRRAITRKVPTRGMGTWPMVFLGAVSSTLSLGAVQAAVLLDAPRWVGWASLACFFLGWLGIQLAIAARHRQVLNAAERASLVIQFGMMFAALAALPVQVALHGGAVAPAFAPLFVIAGMGVFFAGWAFWGRLYLVGLLLLALAALLPLVPVSLWPGTLGLFLLAVQVWFGCQVWRIDRDERRAISDLRD